MAMQGRELGERQRPYAAPANVIAVLNRIRQRNLPERIDDDLLQLVGVPEGARYRVHNTFRFLGLIGDDGRPSDDLRSLAASTDDEYPVTLQGIIRRAYAEDFDNRVDPATDTQAQIVSAFRPYQPRSQTNRMVILFLGLCREAGIEVLDAPRERQQIPAQRPRQGGVAKRTTRKGSETKLHEPPPAGGMVFGVTDDDIAVLSQDEFDDLWAALGKVARARAQSKQLPSKPPAEAGEDDDENEGGGR